MIMIKDLSFVQTCSACPEQYDVFDKEGHQVGYIRFRWGHLTCEYPDCGGEVVYETNFDDDWQGCFSSEDDRNLFLEEIANAIHRCMNKVEHIPVKQVRCVNKLKDDMFVWCKGIIYDVVRYDEETDEWYIKDEGGDTGVVDAVDFDGYFERIDD
jgi:hypothetical protein